MIIFPLSTFGKVALVLIAVVIGLICSMLYFPQKWRWLYNQFKKEDAQEVAAPSNGKKRKDKL